MTLIELKWYEYVSDHNDIKLDLNKRHINIITRQYSWGFIRNSNLLEIKQYFSIVHK